MSVWSNVRQSTVARYGIDEETGLLELLEMVRVAERRQDYVSLQYLATSLASAALESAYSIAQARSRTTPAELQPSRSAGGDAMKVVKSLTGLINHAVERKAFLEMYYLANRLSQVSPHAYEMSLRVSAPCTVEAAHALPGSLSLANHARHLLKALVEVPELEIGFSAGGSTPDPTAA